MKINLILLTSIFTGLFLLTACEEGLPDLFSDDPRDAIAGEWNVEELSELFDKKNAKGFYVVKVENHPSDTAAIYISNFYAIPQKLMVTIDGRNLSIPSQNISGYTIKGSGLISFNYEKIDWSYTVNLNTGEKDNVTAVYTRPEN